ncbi:site-specific integrase [Enterococcus faecium]|uniref:site-specific integrase n=1 Tax=Enterococcus TaxID=1350 RepID=UPI0011C7C9C9|nr:MULTISPECIES: site-specific integrase [Enterococcus]EGP4955425.1 site-specific integrase [Enterococcus faecium]EGP5107616.1 site-specific integrase [Enterococcus faecium]EGP5191988.1 site-specific integrase [Enterococcus faecium]ELI7155652.1 site-specific integrase [Enterococcus faecium]EME3558694.1 site-specific integrase [Enterococcus faecium]
MAMIKQYKKKNGEKAWYFKTYLGIDPLTRKKKYTTKRGFRTQKEAKTALSRLELELQKTGMPTSTNTTFKEAAELWLESYKKTVKESSYSRTKIIFNKHIYPKFGNIKLSKINTAYCQKVVNDWSEKGTSKQYPLFINYMNKVFKYAINIGLTSDNPTLNLLIPKPQIKTEKKLKLYTKEQLELFLNEVSQEQNPYFKNRDYTLFRLLAFSGCRIGEILALTWDNINFKTNEMAIKKTVARSDKYYISETPKTKKSNRIIYLDEKTIKQLKFWKLEQRKYLFQLGFTKANFLFTNDENNFTINQAVAERYNIYRERAGLPYIGLHGFRHTHASMLYEAGADHKEVQERMGHANIKTTMDTYTHITNSKKEETTQKLTNYINF